MPQFLNPKCKALEIAARQAKTKGMCRSTVRASDLGLGFRM